MLSVHLPGVSVNSSSRNRLLKPIISIGIDLVLKKRGSILKIKKGLSIVVAPFSFLMSGDSLF